MIQPIFGQKLNVYKHAVVKSPASSTLTLSPYPEKPRDGFSVFSQAQAILGQSQVRFGAQNFNHNQDALISAIYFLNYTEFQNNFDKMVPGAKLFKELAMNALNSPFQQADSVKNKPGTFNSVLSHLGFLSNNGKHDIITEFWREGLVEMPASLNLEAEIILTPLGIQTAQAVNSLHDILTGATSKPGTKLLTSTPADIMLPETISNFTTDLTAQARKGKLKPLVGREAEMNLMLETLQKQFKHNIKITGDAGVGKTALVEGLAQRIIKGNVPDILKNKRILQVNIGNIVAGTMYRGQFEERVKHLVDYLERQSDVILFMDEFHTSMKAGSSDSNGLTLAQMLKPFLGREQSYTIVATTDDEDRQSVSGDEAIDRRFVPLKLDPPSAEDTQLIITEGYLPPLSQFHKVSFADGVVKTLVTMAGRYVITRNAPDREIDILDSACVKAQKEEAKHVTTNHIAQVIQELTGIPVTSLNQDEKARLKNMESILHERVVGQDEAIRLVSQKIRNNRSGLIQRKGPIGKFLFYGPTGVGKTELAKALDAFMTGQNKELTRIDMGEFTEAHSVSRLIGSPPGYVGHDDGGQLTEAIRRNPYGVILLDEIEKAHPEILKALFSLLDEGFINDSKGNRYDARNTVIIMTSNIGENAREAISAKRDLNAFNIETPQMKQAKMEEAILNAQKGAIFAHFGDALINRVDELVGFKHLTPKEQAQIIQLNLKQIIGQVQQNKGITLTFSDKAIAFLSDKLFAPELLHRQGGRKVEAVIEKYVVTPLIEADPDENSHIEAVLNSKTNSLEFKPVSSSTSHKPKGKASKLSLESTNA